MRKLVLGVWLLLAQQTAPSESPKSVEPEQQPGKQKRTELNLLGVTDSGAGESRRNENIQFNLIDNNALKYLNIRLGTNATIITEFLPERKYFGTEFGNAPGRSFISIQSSPPPISTWAFHSPAPTASSARDRSSRSAASSRPTRTITNSPPAWASGAALT
jgi:hypothetical protein